MGGTGLPFPPPFSVLFLLFGNWSQVSPMPSPSRSAWLELLTLGQLSCESGTPSESVSLGVGGRSSAGSQTSPRPSPSMSSCPGLASFGQLSAESSTPSLSASASFTVTLTDVGPPPSLESGGKSSVLSLAVFVNVPAFVGITVIVTVAVVAESPYPLSCSKLGKLQVTVPACSAQVIFCPCPETYVIPSGNVSMI